MPLDAPSPTEAFEAGGYSRGLPSEDGKPKAVQFPEPKTVAVEIDGVKTISLEKLVELKLASGISAADRLKDLADVQELIKARCLPRELGDHLDESVRQTFFDLHDAVAAGASREGDPHNEKS